MNLLYPMFTNTKCLFLTEYAFECKQVCKYKCASRTTGKETELSPDDDIIVLQKRRMV